MTPDAQCGVVIPRRNFLAGLGVAGTTAVAGCTTGAQTTPTPITTVRVEGLGTEDNLIESVDIDTANGSHAVKISFDADTEHWYDTLEIERGDGSRYELAAVPDSDPSTTIYVGSRGNSWTARFLRGGTLIAKFRIVEVAD